MRHPSAITGTLPVSEAQKPEETELWADESAWEDEETLPEKNEATPEGEEAPLEKEETPPEEVQSEPTAKSPRSRFFRYALTAAVFLLLGCLLATWILTGHYRKLISKMELATPESRKLAEISALLDANYMGEQDKTAQREAMLHAYVAADGDLYGRYYSVEEYRELTESLAGQNVGIGVTITEAEEKNGLLVLWISENSPAALAGIQPGDVLVTVDGQAYSTLGYEGFVSAIRGEIGSRLTVGFFRGDELLEKQITRSAYTASTVIYGTVAGGKIGLIRILSFDEPTADQFAAAVAALREQGVEALIFDVRDNPGGLLDGVVAVLDPLLPEGTICTTRKKDGEQKVYSSDANALDMPMAVICDGETASAAELFTAALRDYKKAVTVGKTTYGKGVAQSTYALSDGSAVKMTTSYYDPPCGVNYDGVGITPDVEVELPEEAKKTSFLALTEEEDTQLAAAIAALQK